MSRKSPIYPNRIRRICGSFSWIEHRFLHEGYLGRLSANELLLYYFLITVGDRNGVSFYGYEKICHLLKMDANDYLNARNTLSRRQLIVSQMGVFQVLPLPAHHRTPASPTLAPAPAQSSDPKEGAVSIAEIFQRIGVKP